jgi:AraC-like DNA-binding protein
MNPPKPTPGRNLPKELREVSVVRITDPTAAGESIELVNLDVVNLDPEQFEIKRIGVPLEECCLIYSFTNAALRTRTRVHNEFEGCWILGPQTRGTIDGAELRSDALILGGPGTYVELIVDRDYESVAFLMTPGEIEKHLALRGIKKDFIIPEGFEIRHPDTALARELFELGTRIAEAAEETPGIFNDSHWARYGAQVEFIDSLVATIESCEPGTYVETDNKGRSYSEIVRACEDYTLNLDGRRPYLSELCATAKVGERTLQYAFQDIMGMSPLTYLNRLRLHRARDELRKANSASTTVTDVAMNWGFWQLGEFSRAYRNCFDEMPSDTLKRNPGD